jgi:hypothetical protein
MAAPARLGRVKKMARLMGIFFIFLIHTRAWNNHLQKSQGAPAMKT